MKSLRPLLAALALCALLHGTSGRLSAQDTQPPLYLVLFRLTAGEDGKLQNFQPIKIIDLLSGSNDTVSVELPQAFLDHARTKVETEGLKPDGQGGKPVGTLTGFLYVPDDGRHGSSGISFGVLNEAMNSTFDIRLMSREAAISIYGAPLGRSAFFISYYAVSSLPKATEAQRGWIIEAEAKRNVANLENTEVLSRKDLSTDSQTIVEVTCKSPANRGLTLRSRYLCNDRQMLSFTAVTPDGLPAEDSQALDQLFDAFRFR